MFPATGMQHACHQVQHNRGSRVYVRLNDLPTVTEDALSLFELAHPHRDGGKRPQRWRKYGAIAQAVALGECESVTTALRAVASETDGNAW